MTIALEIYQLTKNFNQQPIFKDLDFKLNKGEVLSVVGPSGSGKTTLLRVLAGLESPTKGNILMNDHEITNKKANKRNISLVFQQPLLFPHMTVIENIRYGAKLAGNKDDSKIQQLLEAIGMNPYQDFFPGEISGGQQQRVALARAMATDPEVILFDEPFSSLDPNLRSELRFWVRKFLEEHSITSLFVTHDIEEAMIMGDRVGIFHEGIFQQIDQPELLHEYPANAFVANFLGGHIILDKTKHVPLKDVTLSPPEIDVEIMALKGFVQHTTYQNGLVFHHILIKDLNQNIILPKKTPEINHHVTLYVPVASIREFTGGRHE
ncbi:heme ABC exporter ATP-binding protein CcmA [Halobacillus mangrovi]|uniref:Carnitine transport ATP-binding protein OpuCA n=1 Tax=Halobacillus mangrovi TaxID=402384 RepID=A0A1W6A047_9BACI|nr:heme ABC exporter ATP-binding protein CcmA [Halobacillus mangrovi]ARI78867.1 heme ABC exporter ATP-binding protein CcmA [Halobacillus mangrovi]